MKFKLFDSFFVNDLTTKITEKDQDRRHFILSIKDNQVLLAHTTTVPKSNHYQIWVDTWGCFITIEQDLLKASITTVYSAFHVDPNKYPLTEKEIEEIKFEFEEEIEDFESQERTEIITEGTYALFFPNKVQKAKKDEEPYNDSVKQKW